MTHIFNRCRIGNSTTNEPYGQWGWEHNGEKLASIPAGMGTVVISGNVGNGDDFEAGLVELRQFLATMPLRPDFAGYDRNPIGWQTLTPIWPDYPGIVRFHGNFYQYSFAFNFDTNDAELIAEMVAAIDANKATPAYAEAVEAHAEAERKRQEWQEQRDERRRAGYIERLRRELAAAEVAK